MDTNSPLKKDKAASRVISIPSPPVLSLLGLGMESGPRLQPQLGL